MTLDGFSDERVMAIITRLKNGTYPFKPTRRTDIPKKSGKKRPLGISSGDDKLVQEVVRIILERIYEPVFEESSHGFRPERSPHTALQYIDHQGDAVKWWIDRLPGGLAVSCYLQRSSSRLNLCSNPGECVSP